jgi:hypothetical protein
MQLADLALGQSDDLDPGEAQALEDRCRVLLVAGQAIQGFREDDREPALQGVLEQCLHAGTQQAAPEVAWSA